MQFLGCEVICTRVVAAADALLQSLLLLVLVLRLMLHCWCFSAGTSASTSADSSSTRASTRVVLMLLLVPELVLSSSFSASVRDNASASSSARASAGLQSPTSFTQQNLRWGSVPGGVPDFPTGSAFPLHRGSLAKFAFVFHPFSAAFLLDLAERRRAA